MYPKISDIQDFFYLYEENIFNPTSSQYWTALRRVKYEIWLNKL